MHDTHLEIGVRALLVLFVCGGALGCASSSKTKASDQTAQQKAKTPPEPPPPPLEEELADDPCGNPRWSELPDQAGIDGDPESKESNESTSDDSAPAGSEESSSEDRDPSSTPADSEARRVSPRASDGCA